MPKKTRTPKAAPAPATDRRTFLAGLDAFQLSEMLENHDTDVRTSSYWTTYRETKAAIVERYGQEARHFSNLMTAVDAFGGLETAIRQAGFVAGFQAARQLVLGELNLEALKAELPDGAL